MLTDEILISNVLKGDADSFTTLVSRYQNRIFSFLFKMTLSKEDAEEILQDVFMRAYKSLYKFNSQWNFSSWIFKISLNSYKSYYKKKKSNKVIDYYTDIPEVLCDLNDCPEIALEARERYQEIIKLIDNLKLEQKSAFILRYIQGFSNKEIGQILGISTEAVKMRIQRAKYMLCKKYDELKGRGVTNAM